MNFVKKNKAILSTAELARGYLDDSLMISFGILDTTSHYVEVTVQDILMDHAVCSDALEARGL